MGVGFLLAMTDASPDQCETVIFVISCQYVPGDHKATALPLHTFQHRNFTPGPGSQCISTTGTWL